MRQDPDDQTLAKSGVALGLFVEPQYHDKLIKESELTEEFAPHIAGIAELRALDHVIGSPPLRRT